MNIIFTIQHPAHVHLFRNSIKHLTKDGHEVHTFVREKDINIELADQFDFDYELIAEEPKESWHLPFVQLKYEWKIIRAARRLDADVLVAMGEPAIAHASKLSSATSLVFTDTEHATLQNVLAFPFADKILTPECYEEDLGSKQVRYPGYHELAYLHPDRFDPDPNVVKQAGVDPEEKYVILRLVSWEAIHDVGDSGFEDVVDVVQKIENTGARVLITSEADLPKEIEDRRVTIEPHKIHHLMVFSNLFIGESATMATESAVLGTPGIFVSTYSLGYTDELQDTYGLVSHFSEETRQQKAIEKGVEILENYDQQHWNERRKDMLADKMDVTKFIIEQLQDANK
jgi:predicted glycosyltransferase